MKIKSKSSNKKVLVLALSLGILLLIVSVAALYHYKIGPFASGGSDSNDAINYEKPTDGQVDAGDASKQDFEDRTTEASQERAEANGTPKEPAAEQASTIISSSNMNGSTLSVRTILQTIDNSGTCTFTLSRTGNQTISRSAETRSMGSYSSCQGFDVDTSGLEKGDWQAKIDYKGSAGQSGSASKVVTI